MGGRWLDTSEWFLYFWGMGGWNISEFAGGGEYFSEADSCKHVRIPAHSRYESGTQQWMIDGRARWR